MAKLIYAQNTRARKREYESFYTHVQTLKLEESRQDLGGLAANRFVRLPYSLLWLPLSITRTQAIEKRGLMFPMIVCTRIVWQMLLISVEMQFWHCVKQSRQTVFRDTTAVEIKGF